MNPGEHGIDNLDYGESSIREKMLKKDLQSQEKIASHLRDTREHAHGFYLLVKDWLENFALTGEDSGGEESYKETLEKVGEINGRKIILNQETAKEILKKLNK